MKKKNAFWTLQTTPNDGFVDSLNGRYCEPSERDLFDAQTFGDVLEWMSQSPSFFAFCFVCMVLVVLFFAS